MTRKPQTIRVPIRAHLLPYIQRHNEPGEPYGRTIERIIEAAAATNLTPSPPRVIEQHDAWSPEEDALILAGHEEGETYPNGKPAYTFTLPELVRMTGRTRAAIAQRRKRILDPDWTPTAPPMADSRPRES